MPAEMKLINSTSYLNGFRVKVDVQSVSALGGRTIGRERVRECVCVCVCLRVERYRGSEGGCQDRITVSHVIVK